ncbi:thiamine phosphate synthase [Granulicella sibirica]|uniref:Thiamin-phosphate pyrophosphorylase n=1 Tax=Granulicella sibirica TaxID=2479048 RepID=A0A4Q0TA62_9BACT|nr:thiamine phosphate synthase [Granulicella sibirica]RXH58656.1 Thiamin-phosphate pyrophosphorylase [Granulicella sibirica]
MLRYAITDGGFGNGTITPSQGYASLTQDARRQRQRQGLLEQVRQLAFQGIEFVQLREKNLPAGELAELARELLAAVTGTGMDLRVLINTRVDVAVAVAASGVHLGGTPGELTPAQVRALFAAKGLPPPVISKACHTLVEVRQARKAGADLILFSPVFGKWVAGVQRVPGAGLDSLTRACEIAEGIPVLALGGVTSENAEKCVQAGAAGVAGIHLFTV